MAARIPVQPAQPLPGRQPRFQRLVGQPVDAELGRPAAGIVAHDADLRVLEIDQALHRFRSAQRQLGHVQASGFQRGARWVADPRLFEAELAADRRSGDPDPPVGDQLVAKHIRAHLGPGQPERDPTRVVQLGAHEQDALSDLDGA